MFFQKFIVLLQIVFLDMQKLVSYKPPGNIPQNFRTFVLKVQKDSKKRKSSKKFSAQNFFMETYKAALTILTKLFRHICSATKFICPNSENKQKCMKFSSEYSSQECCSGHVDCIFVNRGNNISEKVLKVLLDFQK